MFPVLHTRGLRDLHHCRRYFSPCLLERPSAHLLPHNRVWLSCTRSSYGYRSLRLQSDLQEPQSYQLVSVISAPPSSLRLEKIKVNPGPAGKGRILLGQSRSPKSESSKFSSYIRPRDVRTCHTAGSNATCLQRAVFSRRSPCLRRNPTCRAPVGPLQGFERSVNGDVRGTTFSRIDLVRMMLLL
jgi:hypothetical protein